MNFFTDVLGAELKALYWMHGVPGAKHAFVKLNDSSYIAFVHMPAIEDIPTEIGVTHAGNPAGVTAPGAMQHVAFNVDSLENLLALETVSAAEGSTYSDRSITACATRSTSRAQNTYR